MKIAAAYIRVSDERQDEYSPDSQLSLIKKFAHKHEYLIPPEYIFYDDGISARSTKGRVQFLRMLSLAEGKDHPFDAIIVWKFSRFARNTEDSIMLKARLRRHKVSVLSVSENIDAGSEFSELIERFIEWDDAHYSARLSQEVKRGMMEKASRGEPMSRQFGYDLRDKQLIPNDDAPIVRRIFRDYAAGKGMRQIAVELGADGVRTKRGNVPDNRFVEYILRNPVYVGKIRWSQEGKAASKRHYNSENVLLFDGKHPPLIDAKLWEDVQQMLDEEKRKYPRYQRREQPVGYMLKGLVRCSACGATLCLTQAKGPYPSMQCHNYARGSCKQSHSITVEKAERMTIEGIRQAVESLEFSITPNRSADPQPMIDYEKLIRAEESKLEKAKEAYIAGIDTLEEYGENKQRIRRRIDELAAEQEKQDRTPKFDTAAYAEKVVDVLHLLESDAEPMAKNAALRNIIERIVYNKGEKTFRIFFYT